MLKQKTFTHTTIAILLSALFLLGQVAHTEAQHNIIVSGNPPLTTTMMNRLVTLFEWSLELKFSSAERATFQQIVAGYWQAKNPKSIQSIQDMLTFEQTMQSWNSVQKQEAQTMLQQKLVASFTENSDEMSRFLATLYRQARNSSKPADSVGNTSNSLAGKWQVLHGNSIVSVDRTNGRIGDGNGMIAEYDIKPDGRVIFTFYLQQANAGCTTRVKTSKTGRAVIEGSRVAFHYDGGKTTSEDNCNARYNYTKMLPAESESFTFQLKTEAGKPQFCFANDKLKDCAVKVQ